MTTKYILIAVLALAIISCNAQENKQQNNKKNKHSEAVLLKNADSYLTKDVIIKKDSVSNHVRIYKQKGATGKYITIIPSLGRGVEDFTELYNSTITTKLVEAGYTVVLIQPRGIGRSKGDLTPKNVLLKDMANDIKTTLDSLGIKKLHIIGHAFGNRLARTFATMYPNYVDGLAVLASGGGFELDIEAQKCLRGSFTMSLPDDERVKMIACAFFAKGNDASIWLNGWYPKLAAAEIHASNSINGDFYKKAGGKRFLLVQAMEDFVAPPEKAGRALKNELGDQVTYIEIPGAGHALTSEKPNEVAAVLIKYFK
ncbi:alpha/beta fold hydrolase [Lentimicrobium sp. S6]|uniref:alpha/beta fold hydrolase n=1 Tax=Lentimicrobium sp. S6 TaxID=2735872 RepID=UPI001554A84E|nr:alpha/beta hydrolase [Lentimicrobium sp. S6]NPD47742.1 alpha/beta hydrolase [Lentimicrobium sp. S6]